MADPLDDEKEDEELNSGITVHSILGSWKTDQLFSEHHSLAQDLNPYFLKAVYSQKMVHISMNKTTVFRPSWISTYSPHWNLPFEKNDALR